MKVKVCGITRLEDAQCALDLGAYALGFIFYSGSPRYIRPENAAVLISTLKGSVLKVGVFVNESVAAIQSIIEICGLDMIQLHGSESPEFCRQFSVPVIKSFLVAERKDFDVVSLYEGVVDYFLFDTKIKGKFGGTGQVFDWQLLNPYPFQTPFILSGGLGIQSDFSSVNASILDVNSGVESAPGIKSADKLQRFFELVKLQK